MIADPEGPSFITRTVGHRRYADGTSVTHDPMQTYVRACGYLPHIDQSNASTLMRKHSTPG